MQDSIIKWKYLDVLDIQKIDVVENHFGISLPLDYKDNLKYCNRAKPSKDSFDITGRTECVLDYMVDLDSVVQLSISIGQPNFIAIASDPFGNYLGYIKQADSLKGGVYFWEHEFNSFTKCSDSFEDLLLNLY